MKRQAVFAVLCLLAVAAAARAEKPIVSTAMPGAVVSTGEIRATPEMWFYDQAMRQYKDPQMVVRAKAEMRAEQRMHRVESMRWYGLSNSRPRACSDPMHSDYSPMWVSSPGFYPDRWNGVAQP